MASRATSFHCRGNRAALDAPGCSAVADRPGHQRHAPLRAQRALGRTLRRTATQHHTPRHGARPQRPRRRLFSPAVCCNAPRPAVCWARVLTAPARGGAARRPGGQSAESHGRRRREASAGTDLVAAPFRRKRQLPRWSLPPERLPSARAGAPTSLLLPPVGAEGIDVVSAGEETRLSVLGEER
jgi:hypothetical protein